ncbi:unnamed protein product [Cercopithifilaria johnstoni]|uniref:Uncharacterized protein n=1 Tax=Cercopithifilaria johnstoni TaxID=2874296 RepID=A0A8J2PSW5_9BILA|nr:unnamed protein product [Cercopithifilaria johnstoni]
MRTPSHAPQMCRSWKKIGGGRRCAKARCNECAVGDLVVWGAVWDTECEICSFGSALHIKIVYTYGRMRNGMVLIALEFMKTVINHSVDRNIDVHTV